MRLQGSRRVKVETPGEQLHARPQNKASKGRWRFSDIKLVAKIRKLIQKLKRARLERKTFADFDIRKLPTTKPMLAGYGDHALLEVKDFTRQHWAIPRQSMDRWVEQVVRIREKEDDPDQDVLEDIAYHHYEKSRPKVRRALHTNLKVSLRDYLESLHQDVIDHGVRISPQSDDDRDGEPPRSPAQLTRDENREEFAYRITPVDERPITTDVEARITLSFQSHCVPVVGKILVELMAEDSPFSDLISEAKILGPSELGKRTDSAVLYLNDNREKADQLACYLHQRLTGRVLLDHTPAGMLPLQKGIGFAETHAGDDSSFGMCRGKLVAEAVRAVEEDPAIQLPDALTRALRQHGYDPEQACAGAEVKVASEWKFLPFALKLKTTIALFGAGQPQQVQLFGVRRCQ